MARQNRQTGTWEGLSVVHPHAAGLDIGSEEIWVAVPPASTGEAVRRFGTYTPDLMALAISPVLAFLARSQVLNLDLKLK